MLKLDKEALICDFAEYYHVYNVEELPLSTIATLAVGLREKSRIKMRMASLTYSAEETLLMGILDRLTLLVYSKTKDAQNGRNYPKLLSDQLREQRFEKVEGFTSGEAFEKMREKILRGCA